MLGGSCPGSIRVRATTPRAAPFRLAVRGVVPETQYTVSTTVHERRRCLAGRDRSALQSVLEGPGCCSAPGSCARLRAALSADPAQDMCDQPGSLCDDAGQLVKLDLSDQAGAGGFGKTVWELYAGLTAAAADVAN